MRHRLSIIVLLMASGCGNPETDRMAIGSKAMVYKAGDSGAYVAIGPKGRDRPATLAVGTKVMVIDDVADPGKDWGTRKVRIRVEEGSEAGESTEIYRSDLRPSD